VGEMTAPCLCLEVEISSEIPSIPPQPTPLGSRCAWVLVSVHTEAVGSLILEVPRTGLSGEQVAAAIVSELGGEIARRSNGSDQGEPSLPRFLASRREVLLRAPRMTIVVCTHERPEGLDTCLRSLLALDYPNFSVLVVDNAHSPIEPSRSSTTLDRRRSSTSWSRERGCPGLGTRLSR